MVDTLPMPLCFAAKSYQWRKLKTKWKAFRTRTADILWSGFHIMLKLRFAMFLHTEWKCRPHSSRITQLYKNFLNDSICSLRLCIAGEHFCIGSLRREWTRCNLNRWEIFSWLNCYRWCVGNIFELPFRGGKILQGHSLWSEHLYLGTHFFWLWVCHEWKFHFTITVIEGTFYKEGTFSNPECVLIGVFVSSVT